MHIEEAVKLDFKDVLIRPKRSTLNSRSEVDIRREFVFRHTQKKYHGIPIIAANMDAVGTMEMAQALLLHGLSTALHKHYSIDQLAQFFTGLRAAGSPMSSAFYSMGIGETDFDKFIAVNANTPIDHVCIDVANGYTERFINYVKKVRAAKPDLVIMAGNVVTGDITEELILAGADIVKVGIGPGSVCTTRKLTGIGYPQLSAVIECADAAHGLGGQICADGGCAVPGDLAKAFGGGADFIMLGGMLAGHDECAGELVERDGAMFQRFYGMSSRTAMEKYSGGVATYRASEGKEVLVPYRGPVADTLLDILGGVRSACTYVGAHKLKELTKRTTFIRVTQQLNEVFGKS
ncbi:GMP reductase [Actimicrobium antarcticum]|uniref:GMP reductase n=1 Tax=Actimicrobium antarcticum TaxID=1051899 RepID=A0ABP7TD34_9BURK